MRCKNCGWENPQGSLKCEKCNAPLSGSMVGSAHAPVSRSSEPSIIKGTIPEGQVFGSAGLGSSAILDNNCSKCGYPLARGMNVCPNCGESVGNPDRPVPQHVNQVSGEGGPFSKKCAQCGTTFNGDVKFCPSCGAPVRPGTINPWMTPQNGTFCTLKPIAWQGEGIDYAPLSYSGDKIILNRANTDPNNQSITSKVQAEIISENGEWYLEDRSEQQTTYIHVGRKTKLKTGDIIILGNRRFEFKG